MKNICRLSTAELEEIAGDDAHPGSEEARREMDRREVDPQSHEDAPSLDDRMPAEYFTESTPPSNAPRP